MSRNIYDPSTDTLTPIAGYQPVDQALSDTSGNPVSNRAIKAALDNKADASTVASQIQTLTNQVSTKANQTDLNSLTNTVTSINSALTNYCTMVGATGNVTIPANGQASVILSYTCPSGYKPILASPQSAGNWDWAWNSCAISSTSAVYAVIKSISPSDKSGTIVAQVLCIRDR